MSRWNGAAVLADVHAIKNSNPIFENPAFLLAANDTTWSTPPQITNPLIPYPGPSGYNSDPDHAFDPVDASDGAGLPRRRRQLQQDHDDVPGNARTWTTPTVAFVERNHDAVSPTLVIEPDRTAKLWYIRAGARGCDAAASDVIHALGRTRCGVPIRALGVVGARRQSIWRFRVCHLAFRHHETSR